ncbi:HAD hydrolase family protein [bacterium]|nr:HAD hydrolase family protein [bacterium]
MYCRVFVVDFDGTGAHGTALAPEVETALRTARARGYRAILATGRLLEDLHHLRVDLGIFDAVVAENGGVVWLPARDRLIREADPPPASFLDRIRAAGMPFHVGSVLVGTWQEWASEALDLVRESGLDLQLVFNRGAVMILPSGVTKETGVRRALVELGRSARNAIAFGDAENDLPLLRAVELGVAARGSVASVLGAADERLAHPGPEGVAQFVRRVVEAGGVAPTPARHGIEIGTSSDGRPVRLPADAGNVLVTGDAQSGKSWLAGLLAERLVESGHRIVVIDPEGDHDDIGHHPGALVLGARLPLPDPAALPEVLEWSRTGLVLDLSGLLGDERRGYTRAALRALVEMRERTGLPQWIVVDEAHEALHVDDECVTGSARSSGKLLLATYRPSVLSDAVLSTVGTHLLLPTVDPQERLFLEEWLGGRLPSELRPAVLLDQPRPRHAGMISDLGGAATWKVFAPSPRHTRQTHHGRKYADGRVPSGRGFRFLAGDGGILAEAHDLDEWRAAVLRVPLDSLRHHLAGGDFSRWMAEAMGEAAVAGRMRAVEASARAGAAPGRHEIVSRALG